MKKDTKTQTHTQCITVSFFCSQYILVGFCRKSVSSSFL